MGPERIPEGTYDVGDGYFDMTKRIICKYDGQFSRELSVGDEDWIRTKCRYEPHRPTPEEKHLYQLDGSTDPIIQEMIRLNQDPKLKQAREK